MQRVTASEMTYTVSGGALNSTQTKCSASRGSVCSSAVCMCVCVSAGGSATGADAAHRSSVSADVVLLRHARHPRHDAAECAQLRSVNQSTYLLLASISSAQLVKLLHTGTD